ncbi:MAG: anaerobic ribonucleoside-triphosphate reductase activating protein [Oscillospiraceae bacterium]|nr:anaerobic ribonucleoside-triphosphate reductase activating protein [Oscillospiraceae bacterium]
MYYGEIKHNDIANGIGVRVTLFVSGCRNNCKNCFQPETWSFSYGKEFTKETEDYILSLLSQTQIKGLTLLGGEPFEPENQRDLLLFLLRVRKELPNKTIWAFSGFTLEELRGDSRGHTEVTEELLTLLDVLVDGRYIDELRDISLRFRGSSNQRLIDMPETLKCGNIVLWDK